MRGGIPFTFTIPKEHESDSGTSDSPTVPEDKAIIDALRRYKTVNGKADFDITKAEFFLQALRMLNPEAEPKIIFYEDAVKVRLPYHEREFVIDYNFEEPDNVFILFSKDGKLIVKDCGLDRISQTLDLSLFSNSKNGI